MPCFHETFSMGRKWARLQSKTHQFIIPKLCVCLVSSSFQEIRDDESSGVVAGSAKSFRSNVGADMMPLFTCVGVFRDK